MAAGDRILASDFRIGQVARAQRTTTTGTITTTETGVLRIDNIPVFNGRAYRLSCSNINVDTSVANDIASVVIHYSTSGTATTASSIMGTLRTTIDDATNSNILALTCYYYPSADATLSVLLSCVRTAGTGNIIVFCSGSQILDMVLMDEGVAPANTGVVL